MEPNHKQKEDIELEEGEIEEESLHLEEERPCQSSQKSPQNHDHRTNSDHNAVEYFGPHGKDWATGSAIRIPPPPPPEKYLKFPSSIPLPPYPPPSGLPSKSPLMRSFKRRPYLVKYGRYMGKASTLSYDAKSKGRHSSASPAKHGQSYDDLVKQYSEMRKEKIGHNSKKTTEHFSRHRSLHKRCYKENHLRRKRTISGKKEKRNHEDESLEPILDEEDPSILELRRAALESCSKLRSVVKIHKGIDNAPSDENCKPADVNTRIIDMEISDSEIGGGEKQDDTLSLDSIDELLEEHLLRTEALKTLNPKQKKSLEGNEDRHGPATLNPDAFLNSNDESQGSQNASSSENLENGSLLKSQAREDGSNKNMSLDPPSLQAVSSQPSLSNNSDEHVEKLELAHTTSQHEAIMLKRLLSDVSDRYSRPSTPIPSSNLQDVGSLNNDAPPLPSSLPEVPCLKDDSYLTNTAPTSSLAKPIPTTSTALWWPSVPAKPLVINLKDDSSSEDSDNNDDSAKRDNDFSQVVDNFLLQVRKEAKEPLNGATLNAPLPVAPLSKAQQQEYLELKNEISKRESSQKTLLAAANKDSLDFKKRLLIRKVQETKIKLESSRNLLKKDTMEFEATKSEMEECKNSILEAKRELKLLEGKIALVKNKISLESLRFRKLTTKRACLGMSLKKTTNTLQMLRNEYSYASKQLTQFSQNSGETIGVGGPTPNVTQKATTTTPTKKTGLSTSTAITKTPPSNSPRQTKFVARKTIKALDRTPEKALEKQTLLLQERALKQKVESLKSKPSPKSLSIKLSPLFLKESIKRVILPPAPRAIKSLPHSKEPPPKMAKVQKESEVQIKEIKTDILQTITTRPNIFLPVSLWPSLPKIEDLPLPHEDKPTRKPFSQKPLLTSKVPYTSPLLQLASYRFDPNYKDSNSLSATHFVHGLNAKQRICRFDLMGTCTSSFCKWQHSSEYVPTDEDILLNLLSYHPQLAGVTLKELQDKDSTQTKFKMRAFIDNMKKENPSKSLEELSQLLVGKILEASQNGTASQLLQLKLPRTHPSIIPDEVPEAKPKKTSIPELLRVFDLKNTHEMEPEDPLEDYSIEDARAGRYFANDLEEVVRQSPHYIAAWLQLAAQQFEVEDADETRQLFLALNVLSRGLELNRSEWRLWLPYLELYKHHQSCSDLPGLCLQASQLCPHPRVFWKSLEILEQFEHKDCLANRFLTHLCCQLEATNQPSPEDSRQLLRIILYTGSLHQQTGRPSFGFFKRLLFSSGEHSKPVIELLLEEDRSFAWLCFIHLTCFQFLPDHLFEAQNLLPFSFKRPFYIPWNRLPESFKFDAVLGLFKEAIASCKYSYDCLILLMENLLCLEVHLKRDASSSLCYEQLSHFDDSKFSLEFWRLAILVYSAFNDEEGIFQKVQKANLTHPMVWHALALSFYKKGNIEMSKNLLWMCVLSFSSEEQHSSPKDGHLLYWKLLGSGSPCQLSSKKCLALDEKTICYLWLNYLLFLQCQGYDASLLEEKYELAICSIVSSKFLEEIWWQYLHFSILRVAQSKRSFYLYEKLYKLVRRCLSFVTNEDFHNKVLELYFDSLPSPQHLSSEMVSFCCSWPCNRWLLEKSLFHLIESKDYNGAWSLLHASKKSSLTLNAYKLAISLLEQSNDHYQLHTWFDKAIQEFPYSAKLWKTYLKYELSIGHPNHLKHLLTESSRLQIRGLEDYSKEPSQAGKS